MVPAGRRVGVSVSFVHNKGVGVPHWQRLGFRSERSYRAYRATPEFQRSLTRAQRSARRGATRASIERRAQQSAPPPPMFRATWRTVERHSHRGRNIWQVVVYVEDEVPFTFAAEFDHKPSRDEIDRMVPMVIVDEYIGSKRLGVKPNWRILGMVRLAA